MHLHARRLYRLHFLDADCAAHQTDFARFQNMGLAHIISKTAELIADGSFDGGRQKEPLLRAFARHWRC